MLVVGELQGAGIRSTEICRLQVRRVESLRAMADDNLLAVRGFGRTYDSCLPPDEF